MAYDACGTTRLEGEEIIRRLAKYLNVSPEDLKHALLSAVVQCQIRKMDGQ